MKYQVFKSKYPFKKYPRKHKTILYQGPIGDIPTKYKDEVKKIDIESNKFIIIYKMNVITY